MTAKFKTDWYAGAIPDLIGVLTIAAVIAAVWSVLDRQQTDYPSLNRWLRVSSRYGLGTAMLSYAFIKVIPTQFGYLTPGELLRPLGQLSPFRLLWDFMAASPGYTVFAGAIELFGALLLFFRPTTLLGSILLAGALANVIAVDFAYRVGALSYALALCLINIIILAPYVRPLFDILIMRRSGPLPSEPAAPIRWWRSPAAKAVLVLVLILPLIAVNVQRRRSFFGAGHVIYGMFDVVTFQRNTKDGSPLADGLKWKRVASDPRDGKDAILVQLSNGDLRRFELTEDSVNRAWVIEDKDPVNAGVLNYRTGPNGLLSLTGRIGPDAVEVNLRPIDLYKTFPLLRPE